MMRPSSAVCRFHAEHNMLRIMEAKWMEEWRVDYPLMNARLQPLLVSAESTTFEYTNDMNPMSGWAALN